MKRKLFTVLALCILCVALPACGKEEAPAVEEAEEIVETEEEMAEAVSEPVPEPTPDEEAVESEATPAQKQASDAGLSDDLYSFQLQFNDTVYQLPMSFSDFEAAGWEFQDDQETTLEPYQYLMNGVWSRGSEGTRIYTNIINFASDVLPVTECAVASFSVDSFSLENDDTVILPGGIQLLVSSREDIIAAYGEPSRVHETEGNDFCNMFYTVGSDREIELTVYNDKGLDEISIENMTEPQDPDAAAVNAEVPEAVNQYKAPEALGDDFSAFAVEYDGVLYSLPAPVAEFEKNGWKVMSSPQSVKAQDYDYITIMKDNQSLDTGIFNYGDKETIGANCFITEVSGSTDSYDTNIDIMIPLGITLGMSESDLKQVLNEGADYETEESSSYTAYVIRFRSGYGYEIFVREGAVYKIEVYNRPKKEELLQ